MKIASTIITALITALITSVAVLQLSNRMPQQHVRTEEKNDTVVQTPFVPNTAHEETIIRTVERADKAVVSVIISKDLPVVERFIDQLPFNDFFGFGGNGGLNFGIPRERIRGYEEQEVGGGSAFFIDPSGLLMTNKHVVSDEDAEYTVLLNDGTKLEAEVVAQDPGNDIAILKVEEGNYTALSFASEQPKLGQMVIAIGNALAEFRNTVSVGVISGLKRTVTASAGFGQPVETLDEIIQTDAAINQGNSGGPLLNTKGEVIGMNTAVASSAENISFAIAASDIVRAIESYEEHGKILRPFLGVRYMTITEELSEENNLPYDYGVLIVRGEEITDLAVIPGSPADKAGLTENDIILKIDGTKLTTDVSLARIIQRKSVGDTITLKIYSKGDEKEVAVELVEQE